MGTDLGVVRIGNGQDGTDYADADGRAWRYVLAGSVKGTPKGQPRGRHVRGRVVSWAAAGAAVKAWRTGVTQCGREAAANAGGSAALGGLIGNAPLLLVVRFQFGTANAKRFGLVHTAKPDADNLAKLVMDALKDGGALGPADDARIGRLEASKVWAPQAGCVWTLYRLAGGEGDARGGLAALDGGEGADGMPGWLRLAPAGA